MKLNYLVVMGMIISSYTFAQNIQTDTTKLNEIIISVDKTEISKRNINQQVQTISNKEIENSQSQNTADLLSNNSSVFIQKSQQGGGSITLRGFEANRNLLVIDGVRMNNLIYRGGHLQNVITMDNNYLDKVEILYGPASNIYGSDALGGVVHFYTKKAEFAADNKNLIKVNTLSRYSSANNEITNHIDLNYGLNKIAFLTSATYSQFGDLMGGQNQNPFYNQSYGLRNKYVDRVNNKDSLFNNPNKYKQTFSGYNQIDLMQKISFKQTEFITHNINFQYSTSTDIPRYDRLTDPSGKGLKYAQWYYGPQERLLGIYNLNYKNENAFFQKIDFGLNYQDIEESRHSRKFNKNQLQHRIENVNVYGLNLDLFKNFNSHLLHLGIDGQYNNLVSTANEEDITNGTSTKLDTRYPDGKNTFSNIAAYLTHSWKINETLILNDGVRAGFTSLNSTFIDTSFFNFPIKKVNQNNPVYSGSIGIVHNPNDQIKVSAGVSTGYRVPNVDDLSKVFESAPGKVILPNPNLKPEKTITYDIGLSNYIKNKTVIENNIYFTDFYDAIVARPFQYNGMDSIIYMGTKSQVYANQNKRRAYIYGFSNSIYSNLNSNFALSFMFNYTYGRIKTDTTDYPLDHIPPISSRIRLIYKYGKFNSEFFINYNGWKKIKDYYIGGEDNEVYATPLGMPAWFTANLRASYEFCKNFTLRAGIENIFDTQYRVFASGINGAGRNIYTTVQFRF